MCRDHFSLQLRPGCMANRSKVKHFLAVGDNQELTWMVTVSSVYAGYSIQNWAFFVGIKLYFMITAVTVHHSTGEHLRTGPLCPGIEDPVLSKNIFKVADYVLLNIGSKVHLKFRNPFSIIPGKEFNRDIMAVAYKPFPTARTHLGLCTKSIQVKAGGVLLRIDKLDSLAFGTIKVRREWIRFRDPYEINHKRSTGTVPKIV